MHVALRAAIPAALLLLACPAEEPDEPINDDSSAPTVTATSPEDGAFGIEPLTPLAVTFSEALHPASITAESLAVSPESSYC